MTLEELHKLSFKNKEILLSKTKCGCFYCKKIFAPSDITDFPDLDNTLSKDLLELMYQRYFGK